MGAIVCGEVDLQARLRQQLLILNALSADPDAYNTQKQALQDGKALPSQTVS